MSKTKERPIILTAEEANAVLVGDKTQHRVLIENNTNTQCLFSRDWRYDGRDFLDDGGCMPDPKGAHYVERLEPEQGEENQYTEDYRCIGHCPVGKVGDRLWVQEDHARQRRWEEKFSLTGAHYFADGPLTLDVRHDAGMLEKHSASDMPRWASRLLLEITDIRIERILDISDTDAKAMGLKPDYCDHKYQSCENIGCIGKWAGALFLHLRHDKKLAVHYTDWVWAIEFKGIKETSDG